MTNAYGVAFFPSNGRKNTTCIVDYDAVQRIFIGCADKYDIQVISTGVHRFKGTNGNSTFFVVCDLDTLNGRLAFSDYRKLTRQ